MKKTLLSTAVLAALSVSFAAFAGDDVLVTTDADAVTVGGGATAVGAASIAKEVLANTGNNEVSGSYNAELSNAFNDVNSDNVTTIAEDGIVAHANDLNQAVASSDSKLTVAGNEVLLDSALSEGPLSAPTNTTLGVTRAETNTMQGSFTHFSGISAVDQNIGSSTAVAQSVVVQSNGGI